MTKPLQNLIFDLGGVLLHTDFNLTFQAFAKLGINDFSKHFSHDHQTRLVDRFETGRISGDEFRLELCRALGINPNPTAFAAAWSAMIVGFDKSTFKVLKELAQNYRIFLLSNTNPIHVEKIELLLWQECGEDSLDVFFEAPYYSHTLGLRKPDRASYDAIIKRHKLDPEATLFIDDSATNIAGAQAAKLQVLHFTPGMTVADLPEKLSRYNL